MIIGVTHDSGGRVVQWLSVSTKIAIGLRPNGDRNHPTKLDHFVFLRKKRTAKGVEWERDPELTEHYGKDCRQIRIVLIDDDIENIFPTSYAWWTAAERKCWGNGTSATRRTAEKLGGQPWMPCGSGCPELASGQCKPGGDLRFVLADFPRLGSVCRIHTNSYRSIRQIHSALQEIQSFTGGRLAGLTAKLVVRPEETSYFDAKDRRKKSTTIWALSLEVDGEDMKKLAANLTENARVFAETRKLLGSGRIIEVVEDEAEQASEVAAEFYSVAEVPPSCGEKRRAPEGGGQAAKSVPLAHVESNEVNAPRDGAAEPPRSVPAGAVTNDERPAEPPPWEPERTVAQTNSQSPSTGVAGLSGPQQPGASTSKPNGVATGNGAAPKTSTVRGISGPLEPDESGNTVRRNSRGVEYVIFKVSQNGSAVMIYCNRPELLPEIARRQGREAGAQVTVTGNNGHQYYVLNGFLQA